MSKVTMVDCSLIDTSNFMRGATRWNSLESLAGSSGMKEGNSLSMAIMISLDSAIVRPFMVATGKPPDGLTFIKEEGFSP
jgi:hypothetical protein